MTMNNTAKKYLLVMLTAALMVWSACVGGYEANAQEQTESQAFSGLVINVTDAKPFKLTATIMEVKKGRIPYAVVAEKVILITDYKLEAQVKSTRLVGESGQTLTFSQLKKDQRVIVEGLELSDGTIVGETLQVKSKKKK